MYEQAISALERIIIGLIKIESMNCTVLVQSH
ncbi:MAG: hypothetical protein H6Q71_506 [Firmicutes bacterium]|nr:hypothetical protein [Bacillota bacterium]